jgi:hypothetical protein
MMLSAKHTDVYQGLLWAEAVHTAKISTVNSVTKRIPDNMFYGDMNPRMTYKLTSNLGM